LRAAGYGVQQAETVDPNAPYDPNSVKLGYNGDMLRSTMLLTDQNAGSPVQWSTGYQPVVSYTAFGDPIYRDPNGTEHVGPLPEDPNAPADFPRYQYAGGWGYESGYITLQGANTTLAPITLQHVGWRWYQPGVGRFVQRDPIGLQGGLNSYVYADTEPLSQTDPDGLSTDERAWVDPRVNPPLPLPPKARCNPGPGSLVVLCTGGDHSWLDKPRTVKRVQLVVKVPVTVLSWVPGVGWTLKVVMRTMTIIGWLQEGYDLW
jgi:RHS repeat-associated protein